MSASAHPARARAAILGLAVSALAACAALPPTADPASDAPEARVAAGRPVKDAASYGEALSRWHDAGDVNAWIGARFSYDRPRALLLSETQRQRNGRMPIIDPEAFFATARGVCVDLSRFGVETLRAVDPGAKPAYLMIEFDPVSVGGNVLRRHWLVAFERDGQRYFFADSKRPGYIAGPYASTQEFIAEYARYRGRQIVSFRELQSYERKKRTLRTQRTREERR